MGVTKFERTDQEIESLPLLEELATLPPLDLVVSEETETRLPGIAGGLSHDLGRSFSVIEPKLKHPATEHWERATRIFDLVM